MVFRAFAFILIHLSPGAILMTVSFYDLTVGSYVQIVEAAVGVLEKGADYCGEKGIDLDDVVGTCLIDDMANFHFQVVCITHHSLEALNAMKTGEFLPPNYEQMDYAGLQSLTGDTLATLKGMSADEVNALAGGSLVFKLGGNEIPFSNENFALSFSLPNFYFHATTAYDILRAQGVPLGKRDFLGAMKIG
jgi:hypothetical protein